MFSDESNLIELSGKLNESKFHYAQVIVQMANINVMYIVKK